MIKSSLKNKKITTIKKDGKEEAKMIKNKKIARTIVRIIKIIIIIEKKE